MQERFDHLKTASPKLKYDFQKLDGKFECGEFQFLRVGHCQLNPTEIVRGTVKRTLAPQNLPFNLSQLEKSLEAEMS